MSVCFVPCTDGRQIAIPAEVELDAELLPAFEKALAVEMRSRSSPEIAVRNVEVQLPKQYFRDDEFRGVGAV